jgi:hypothetical protein
LARTDFLVNRWLRNKADHRNDWKKCRLRRKLPFEPVSTSA